MTPEILPAVLEDLEWDRDFYDGREEGIGSYFVRQALALASRYTERFDD